jgi:hypothetical protein
MGQILKTLFFGVELPEYHFFKEDKNISLRNDTG